MKTFQRKLIEMYIKKKKNPTHMVFLNNLRFLSWTMISGYIYLHGVGVDSS